MDKLLEKKLDSILSASNANQKILLAQVTLLQKETLTLKREQSESKEIMKSMTKQLKQMQMLQNLMAKKVNQVASNVAHPGQQMQQMMI